MKTNVTQQIVVPIDGSPKALNSLDYLSLLFGPEHSVEITLFYVLPTLPPLLVDEKKKDPQIARKLREVEDRNNQMAERILDEAKRFLLAKDFRQARIKTVCKPKDLGVARDICNWAEMKGVHAVMVSTRGRTRLQSFFMGEVSRNLLEHIRGCPLWMVDTRVRKRPALIAVDSSENALRAVEHAAIMLSGTDVPVTLFHSKRNLWHFVPKEIIEKTPELQEIWQDAAGRQVAPYLEKAREILLNAGFDEKQIAVKVLGGSRNAATDILKAAHRYGCGTVVVGRRGITGVKEFIMGGVTRKLLEDFSGLGPKMHFLDGHLLVSAHKG